MQADGRAATRGGGIIVVVGGGTGTMTHKRWRCGDRVLDLERPVVMGILNVTPDSFSDGGRFATRTDALGHGRAMLEAGAAIVDVGGESTRPGAGGIDSVEERRRVEAVVRSLAGSGALVSIDTRHAEVAEACLEAGAAIINDVSGFRDERMVGLAARSDAGLVVMHMLGEPGTMQDSPSYDDVVAEVRDYLAGRAAALQAAGVAPERIAVDPGIGFGKTLEHNLALLRGIPAIAALGHPVVIGASRKRFLGALTGVEEPRERLGGSVAAALFAAERGASVLRVHDVPETVQALQVHQALEGSAEGGLA